MTTEDIFGFISRHVGIKCRGYISVISEPIRECLYICVCTEHVIISMDGIVLFAHGYIIIHSCNMNRIRRSVGIWGNSLDNNSSSILYDKRSIMSWIS